MRDVSFKVTTKRTAIARAELRISPATLVIIRKGRVPKGDPLTASKVVAVMAAKKTAEWIPFCHNIPIEFVEVSFDLQPDRIVVDVAVTSIAKTGVEMEALTAASAAVLNLYDMLKMLDEDMEILTVRLLEKRGGKSDVSELPAWTARVLVVSDRVAAGIAADKSGDVLIEGMVRLGASEAKKEIVSDDENEIQVIARRWCDEGIDLILITGGTGVGPHDVTPEALAPIIERELPGISETFRRYGQERMRTALLSRCVAGVTGNSLIIALPGSPAACEDALHALFPGVLHAKAMLMGNSH